MTSPHPNLPDFARSLELSLDELARPLDWEALFGRSGPNAIEIGTGNGYFIAAEAARLPRFNFIGIERDSTFYAKMVKRCARAGLANVRTTRLDALELLRRWIPRQSLARVYCYFSDPWHKRRHRARRVFTDAFPPLVEPLLAPGGELWFKTDVGWYFNLAVTVFRERGGWDFLEIGRQSPPDPARGDVITNFERKAREAGSKVWGFRVTPDDAV
ncbi:MAG: tRNA (guanosine(46)-N7)-methyltransferase TrmB [bacterium]|nr:tRNA (guanosine(46)-N7)-methyltransferase TrmB [bacterium]